MKINDYKLTTKLIISCIIVFMWIWLVANLGFSKLLYEDYQNVCNELNISEEKFYKLWNIHVETLKSANQYKTLENEGM